MDTPTLYAALPGMDRLLSSAECAPLAKRHGRHALAQCARAQLDAARAHIAAHAALPDWASSQARLAAHIASKLEARQQMALRPVFNLTGTVLHTNLGRAIQAEAAVEAVSAAMRGAVTLEYDLDGAGRGHRDTAVSELIRELTGAEAACVVNNNAAAVLITLSALGAGREVIVSRGELVEIGGAFRMPDVMRQAGCILAEVGATNRTHLKDYAAAIGAQTALLMKVHTSNYAIEGFTKSVSEAELVPLAREHGLPVVTDLGAGALIDLAAYGLPAEPMPQAMLAAGVDIVTFSGDKLLGGPQAGIIAGSKALIDRIQAHPLKRALRCDKLTLAALEATLRLYLQPDLLRDKLPTLRLLTRTPRAIREAAQRLLPVVQAAAGAGFEVKVEDCASQIGSGSLPVDRLPSVALTLTPRDGKGGTLLALSNTWRALPHPVIGRISDGRLWLDLRCLEDEAAFSANFSS
ncbi:L-seryl-tRNA(Sec) selenium transferase [Craterilacuibacter sinensis]|uniref:L-seryl-tRNA(Sec) selenium transferase n=1 Tax=Craterilacuibacter sinensis TaxID=2686017 RepID=A0A845BNP0_9NEIS|nr:L-seryl-tRNA(Sec) selenium transferase [Craterilacuibacter sinensis]MXR38052.1 L-seryl-tRNA(Sec) selenium transferase [Craterilacuibacter sinensis]